MDIGIVSMRYAKALMEYAKSTGTEDRLYAEMRMLSRSFEKHPDLRTALENPVLSVQEKFSLICAATVGDAPAERELARFIMLVLKNRRESFLQYICLSFLDLVPPICCMLKWSYRLMLILLLKVDLYSTLTIFAWMPVLLLS